MIIMGMDVATRTGWSFYDTKAPLSSIRVGHIDCEGVDYENKAAFLGKAVMKLIKAERPDFIVMERPIRTQPGKQVRKVKMIGDIQQVEVSGSGLNAVISSNQLVGSVSGIIGAYALPFETIASVSWRKSFLGFGTRSGWQRKDWKKAARDRCEQFKIKVKNDDQAEAVGIAFHGAGLQQAKLIEQRAAQRQAA